MNMKTNLTVSIVLAIVMLIVLSVGLLDPLEGLLALILGVVLAVAARLLSKLSFPKLAWISFTVAAGILAIVLGFALFVKPENTMAEAGTPLSLTLVIALWLSRVAIIVMDVGIVIYIVRLFKARQAASGS